MDELDWMEDESRYTVAYVAGPVGSNPTGCSGGFEPSVKLRARIEKLVHWRIDPSLIHFGGADPESHGGHATVSGGQMEFGEMDMRDMEKRAFSKKLVGKAMDDFLKKREELKSRWRAEIAVKKMRVADDTDFERVVGLTLREAELLAELDHSNIVELEGFVEDVSKGIIWLVFPWSYDGNLRDFIAKEKWEIPERISLISDVAKGLEYLHTRSPPICHGDLKSLNVLIYDLNVYVSLVTIYARIADFGSARRLPRQEPNTQIEEMVNQSPSAQPPRAAFCASTQTITLTGNKYTLRWAAPELLLQDQLSLWSDIWALGWIAYEVMTGSLPFEDTKSDMVVVKRVLEGKLPSLSDNAHLLLMHELCSLMSMCWELKPTERPAADSCRRSIEKMPMFAPEMDDDRRYLSYDRKSELGHLYQSRGEYARAFTFFVDAFEETRWTGSVDQIISTLRDLAQLARLRNEGSKTIAFYDSIYEIYSKSDEEDKDDRADNFPDFGELHQYRYGRKQRRELRYEGLEIQGQQRIANTLRDMAQGHWYKCQYNKAILLYSELSKIYTDLGDREGRADALWVLADVHRHRREYEKAIVLYSESLQIFTNLGDQIRRADVLSDLANLHRREGKYQASIPLYSEALQIYTDVGDRESKADAVWGLADVHRRRSEYDKAVPLYSELLEVFTHGNEGLARADALWGLADVHRRRSEYNKAIPLYVEGLKISTYFGDQKIRAVALWGLAQVYRLHNQAKNAIPLLSEALQVPINFDDTNSRANVLWGIAEVHRLHGEYDEATLLYLEAFELWTDIDDGHGRAVAILGLADVYSAQHGLGDLFSFHGEIARIL